MVQSHLDNAEGFKELDLGGNTGYDKKDFLLKTRINTSSNNAALELKVSQTEELSNETYLGLTFDDYNEKDFAWHIKIKLFRYYKKPLVKFYKTYPNNPYLNYKHYDK